MGRRTLRLRTERLGAADLMPHIGRVVDVVGVDGVTRHGRLLEVSADALVIEDSNAMWYNRRQHRHRLALAEVQEVLTTPWQGY